MSLRTDNYVQRTSPKFGLVELLRCCGLANRSMKEPLCLMFDPRLNIICSRNTLVDLVSPVTCRERRSSVSQGCCEEWRRCHTQALELLLSIRMTCDGCSRHEIRGNPTIRPSPVPPAARPESRTTDSSPSSRIYRVSFEFVARC